MKQIIIVMLFVAALNYALCSVAQISAGTTLPGIPEPDSAAVASAIPDRVITPADLSEFNEKRGTTGRSRKEEQAIYKEMVRRCEFPASMRMAPTSVLVDTVTIVDPYLVEDNDVYYLIEGKSLDFENPKKSLKKEICFAILEPWQVGHIIFAMSPKMYYNLEDRNMVNIDYDVDIEIYKKSRRGNIYRYTRNVTKFLITLVQISKLNRLIDVHYDFLGKPPKNLPHPVVKNDMPYSQYILVASPLMSDKGK